MRGSDQVGEGGAARRRRQTFVLGMKMLTLDERARAVVASVVRAGE